MTYRCRLTGRFPRRLLRCTRGVSAVEFALFAPMLFFALVVVADLGLALYQRMTIDHILRAGAQSATMDPGVSSVEAVLEATRAEAGSWAEGLILEGPDRYHACPESPGTSVLPGTDCAGGHTHAFYFMAAHQTYDGLFLPIEIGRLRLGPVELGSSIEVQVR